MDLTSYNTFRLFLWTYSGLLPPVTVQESCAFSPTVTFLLTFPSESFVPPRLTDVEYATEQHIIKGYKTHFKGIYLPYISEKNTKSLVLHIILHFIFYDITVK